MNELRSCLIGDVAEIIGGGTPSTKNKENYGGDIAWITPKDLSDHDAMYISKGERSITNICHDRISRFFESVKSSEISDLRKFQIAENS